MTTAALKPWITVALVALLAGWALARHLLGGHDMVLPLVVVVVTIALWATRVLPEYLVAFIFFVLCALGTIAPPSVFLSGFTGPAVWLVVSGAVIGVALRHTGLSDRLGAMLAGLVKGSYPLVLARVAAFGTGLAFVMPSGMGRIFLLAPLLDSLAVRAGLAPGSRARAGIMLAGIFGTFFPAMAILPANVPNNVLAGLLETTGIGVPSFSRYLLLHFPVLGLGKLALIVALLSIGFRDVAPLPGGERTALPPLSAVEKRLVALLIGTIGLWLTDGWHGIPAAWVGMLGAIVCLWPGSGLMPQQPLKAVGFETIVYVAGVVGLGAIVDHTGIGAMLAQAIPAVVGPAGASPLMAVLVLAGVAFAIGPFVTAVGVPAILTPIAPMLAAATGLPVEAVVMSQVIGFSTVLLPYQAPPLAVAVQAGVIPGREGALYCFVLAVLTVVLIWPLDIVWWRLLGWL
ncbi:Sodium/sulfate symporter [Rhodovulum sp. PH10]|uniref:SLC13 family permease n=1 Tax=Rhodovulum sp. PH10 TaxID=1187851 RepID=UPI00027C220D|nr:SLC13 family permease [Rhodovulum sp. PH10]EJW11453.1 Sodium/sulfate symporter [Rhodovulum sp. PH10]